ncbi:hypothetical protein LMG28614_04242 [Paraburkholderia ultramafica]|uniref:Uncharacterized protein n=1 Tax=Paraburkholderia ultramafica TaxID=1544867 RepID=A0A6S7BCR1_9BURK|nr:hypothetical protein LMG28614_04242 [Paraburkholderia ultramafica]
MDCRGGGSWSNAARLPGNRERPSSTRPIDRQSRFAPSVLARRLRGMSRPLLPPGGSIAGRSRRRNPSVARGWERARRVDGSEDPVRGDDALSPDDLRRTCDGARQARRAGHHRQAGRVAESLFALFVSTAASSTLRRAPCRARPSRTVRCFRRSSGSRSSGSRQPRQRWLDFVAIHTCRASTWQVSMSTTSPMIAAAVGMSSTIGCWNGSSRSRKFRSCASTFLAPIAFMDRCTRMC